MGRAPPDLVDRLRSLTKYAEAGGAPRDWLQETSDAIFGALLDPRHQRALGLAARVKRAHEQGVSIAELCERFDRKRSAIYRLLRVQLLRETTSRETLDV